MCVLRISGLVWKSFDLPEGRDDLSLFLKLFEEDLPHQVAGPEDLGVRNPVIDINPVPAGQDDALRSQDAHVLGEIGFAQTDLLDQFPCREFLVLEGVDDFQPLRVRENLADVGVKLVDSFQGNPPSERALKGAAAGA